MKIGILGDTHGNTSWVMFALWKFAQEGIKTIVQVGDFGLYNKQSGHNFLKKVQLELQKYDQTLHVVPGNHEDWDWIDELVATQTGEDGWTKVRQSIFLAPRGHRWVWDNVNFLALGGAPSVDRGWRVRDQAQFKGSKLWWANEMVTPADVDKVVAGGRTDVFFAHDVFENVPSVDNHISGNPMGFEAADLLYAAEGRVRMTEAFRGTVPTTWIHGHYHFGYIDKVLRPRLADGMVETQELKWTNVVGLAADGSPSSLGVYDTSDKTTQIWDVRKDITTYNARMMNPK